MRPFGLTNSGKSAHLLEAENAHFRIAMTDYGATLVSFVDKKSGIDIVQGFDDVSAYENEFPYMGSTVGRVCNRIAGGRFVLGQHEYTLPRNDRGNTLHGGPGGFASCLYQGEEKENAIEFSLFSPDGDQGFPGNVRLTATYTLTDDGLEFCYQATSDRDTLVSITNHSYFNLDGPRSTSALNELLQIDADQYYGVDQNGLAKEPVLPVEESPFDFRTLKPVGRDLFTKNAQLTNGGGYDHHFVIRGQGYRHFATLQTDRLQLDIYSDLPGVQLYTSNEVKPPLHGKQGGTFPAHSAVCLETQYVPDAINMQNSEKPILQAGTTMCHRTFFQLKNSE